MKSYSSLPFSHILFPFFSSPLSKHNHCIPLFTIVSSPHLACYYEPGPAQCFSLLKEGATSCWRVRPWVSLKYLAAILIATDCIIS